MQNIKKLAIVATAVCGIGLAMSTPSQAHEMHHYRYHPVQGLSIYQNPDGTYDSIADLSRDIRGIPCGIECTGESQARWAHYYGYGTRSAYN